MSRRRGGGAAVRGPASALTSFLAGLGVQPSASLTTWGNTSSLDQNGNPTAVPTDGETAAGEDGETGLDPASIVTARNVEAGPSIVEDSGRGADGDEDDEAGESKGKPKAKGKKRSAKEYDSDALDSIPTPKKSRATSIDSDDLDFDVGKTSTTNTGTSTPAKAVGKLGKGKSNGSGSGTKNGVVPGPLKAVGQFMLCGECGNRFTVTAYTKEHPSTPSTYLCVKCCNILGIDPFAKSKKGGTAGKKGSGGGTANKKEDRAKIVHYEHKKGVLGLGDMCIEMIGKYIENVEQLGDIGGINMDKVCKIISKSRKLTPETAPLFYSIDRTDLTMYDCTNLQHEAFVTLANLCPNIENLHLHLVGQLQTESVQAWAQKFHSLRRLELFGPFLVRKPGWIDFFHQIGPRLEGFLITQSPRIDLETITELVNSCPNLTELRLAEVGQLDNDCLQEISKLQKLRTLDLSAPANSLSDDAVIGMINAIGGTLESLDLSDNPDLTDLILPSIATNCPKLKELHLRNLLELTDDGVGEFFETLKEKNRPGFKVLDLEKGHDLGNKALGAIIDHSGKTILSLNVLGWRGLEKDVISMIGECRELERLDIGWCRNVTDWSVKDILEGCQSIKTIKVWGCNQLTDAVPRKKGVKVIGIETHSI